ncbi:MAG TPA: hypothetical protein VNY79_00715 [Xanthobacteraceae bacterium]|nr:hypothetical protein [Xanthobacteraceae bacterium]
MINHISYTALGIALLAGASAANAQTLIADQPGAVIVREQPARTVETVRTVRTVEPARTMKSHHVARRASAKVVTTTTTRTIVRDRVVRGPTVIAPAPATYSDTAPAPVVADMPYSRPLYDVAPGAGLAEPAYSRPLYNVAAPVVAPAPFVGAAPAIGAAPAAQSGMPIPGYRYVYEPDRILVIDPYTNIAVQAIPR